MWTRQNAKVKSWKNVLWQHFLASKGDILQYENLLFVTVHVLLRDELQRVSGCFLNDRCSLKRSLSLVFKTSFWRDDTNFSSLNRAIGQILALRWPAVDPGVGRAPAEICRSWKRSKNRRLYVPVIHSYYRNSRLDAKNCRSWDLRFFDMSDKF